MNWLAGVLMRLALRVMPRRQREWADAMHAEIPDIKGIERLFWAFGCLIATLRQRFSPMNAGSSSVSRWVMAIETVGCFGPVTFAWYEITVGASGVVRLSGETVEKLFLPYPGGPYILAMMIGAAIVGLIGVAGLALGCRYVMTGRGLQHRAVGFVLIGTLAAYCVLGAIAGYVAGPPQFAVDPGTTVLFGVLPVVGIAHLMYVERKTPGAIASVPVV